MDTYSLSHTHTHLHTHTHIHTPGDPMYLFQSIDRGLSLLFSQPCANLRIPKQLGSFRRVYRSMWCTYVYIMCLQTYAHSHLPYTRARARAHTHTHTHTAIKMRLKSSAKHVASLLAARSSMSLSSTPPCTPPMSAPVRTAPMLESSPGSQG